MKKLILDAETLEQVRLHERGQFVRWLANQSLSPEVRQRVTITRCRLVDEREVSA